MKEKPLNIFFARSTESLAQEKQKRLEYLQDFKERPQIYKKRMAELDNYWFSKLNPLSGKKLSELPVYEKLPILSEVSDYIEKSRKEPPFDLRMRLIGCEYDKDFDGPSMRYFDYRYPKDGEFNNYLYNFLTYRNWISYNLAKIYNETGDYSKAILHASRYAFDSKNGKGYLDEKTPLGRYVFRVRDNNQTAITKDQIIEVIDNMTERAREEYFIQNKNPRRPISRILDKDSTLIADLARVNFLLYRDDLVKIQKRLFVVGCENTKSYKLIGDMIKITEDSPVTKLLKSLSAPPINPRFTDTAMDSTIAAGGGDIDYALYHPIGITYPSAPPLFESPSAPPLYDFPENSDPEPSLPYIVSDLPPDPQYPILGATEVEVGGYIRIEDIPANFDSTEAHNSLQSAPQLQSSPRLVDTSLRPTSTLRLAGSTNNRNLVAR